MIDVYPRREQFFANRFCRLLTKTVAAQEIGPDGCWLLCVVAHQEDAKRYRGAVTFYNGQLLSPAGFYSEDSLIRVRHRCIEAGWLHYEPGAKRRPGRYWVTIPPGLDVPDTAIDEGTPQESTRIYTPEFAGEDNGNVVALENTPAVLREKAERKPRESAGPSNLYLSPNPKESARAKADVSANAKPDTPKPSPKRGPLTKAELRDNAAVMARLKRHARRWGIDPDDYETAVHALACAELAIDAEGPHYWEACVRKGNRELSPELRAIGKRRYADWVSRTTPGVLQKLAGLKTLPLPDGFDDAEDFDHVG